MGSRSKQGTRETGNLVGCFVTCDRCKFDGGRVRGSFDELVTFIEAHRSEHPDHELKVWIPVQRWN